MAKLPPPISKEDLEKLCELVSDNVSNTYEENMGF